MASLLSSQGRGRGRGRGSGVKFEPVKPTTSEMTKIDQKPSFKENLINDIKKHSVSDDFRKSAPKFVVEGMTINFISTKEMRALSAVTCTQNCNGYDKSLDSPAMGTTSKYIPCGTCNLVDIDCPGHFGLIELTKPLFHPLAIDYITNILQSLCYNCNSLVLDISAIPSNIIKLPTYSRIREISLISKNKVCHSCEKKADVTYSTSKDKENNVILATISKSKKSFIIKPSRVLEIFNSIESKYILALGFNNDRNHPRNLILEVLPVIPERNRPPTFSDGEFKPDHLTIIYSNIIKENRDIKDLLDRYETETDARKGAIDNDISSRIQRLWNTISNFINNKNNELKIRKNEEAKTLNKRITGKEGYPRFFAQGKRSDYTGRTVIGPGIIPFGYVILPSEMRILTVFEKVHSMNIERIKDLASKGEIERLIKPGKSPIFYKVASQVNLSIGSKPIEIEIGDTVTRYASTGDDVFLNRQPTLHRHSMTGCRTVFHSNKKTIQIHMAYTTPQNADFDGDESNINMPQSLYARSELRNIMGGHNQLISVGNCKPTMGLVFNCPTAAYLLSKDAVESDNNKRAGKGSIIIFTPEDEAEINGLLIGDSSRLKSLGQRLKKYKIDNGTARALFSMTLPEDYYYFRPAPADSDEDPLVIKEGVFISGIMVKSDVAGGLIQSLHLKYGGEVTGQFISEAQFILDWYIERRGFTIGLRDMLLTDYKKSKEMIKNNVNEIRQKVFSLDNTPYETSADKLFRNRETRSILDSIKSIGKKLADPKGNSLGQMVKSGAKGSFDNISSIMGIVGQQFINGKRPDRNIYGDRTMCYFDPGDQSLEAGGFVMNAFADGLSPAEFFFHSQGARNGLLDTALKTGEIGALTHKIGKVMENYMVGYNGSVVDSKGVYTSMAYGEGYNRGEMTRVSFSSTNTIYMPFDLKSISKQLNEE